MLPAQHVAHFFATYVSAQSMWLMNESGTLPPLDNMYVGGVAWCKEPCPPGSPVFLTSATYDFVSMVLPPDTKLILEGAFKLLSERKDD